MAEDDFTDKEIVDGDKDVDFFDSHDNTVNDANNANDGSYSKEAPATKKKRKKTGGKRATKRNKTCPLNNTTIIKPDLVLQSGKHDADGKEGDTDGYSGGDDDSNSDNNFFEDKRYKKPKANIGRSTPKDVRGGRFIQFLSEGQRRHLNQRYPRRS